MSEARAQEFGVIAGLLLFDDHVDQAESSVAKIFSGAATDDYEKPHATELFRDGANSGVRDELFEYLLKQLHCLIIYEAVYARGVLEDKEAVQAIIQRSIKQDRAALPRSRRTRVLTTLLTGIIFQADTICRSSGVTEVQLESDFIDGGLLKEARAELASLQSDSTERVVTSWDAEAGLCRGRVVIHTTGFDNRTKRVGGIGIGTRYPYLVLAADVLSNSLYHTLRELMATKGAFPPLHNLEALEGFVLRDKVANLRDGYFTDLVFRPREQSEIG